MASPDFTPYVDLTIYDTQPKDIYDAAVLYAQTAVPEWTPISGSVEDAIIQAGAYYAGYLGGAINRVTDGVLEGLLKLLNIDRTLGVAPTGSITITVIDSLGYTIPAGTRFGYLDTSDPTNPILYSFDTTLDLTIPQGSTSGVVDIVGTGLMKYPTLSSGTSLQLYSAVSSVQSASLAGALNVGADAETDSEYLARAVSKLNSYSTALVTVDQIQQYILASYSDAYRVKAYSRVDPTNETAYPTTTLVNGYVTVYVCKKGGASLTANSSLAIQSDIISRMVTGLTVTVKTPTIVPISVSVTVTMKSGYGQATVSSNVSSALATYLHPDYWQWNGTIYYNELISLIDQVAGVDQVTSLTLTAPSGGATVNGSNLVFNKYGSLPSVTALVTVTT